jgi:MarR family 2-MHQ and catechol resistance regulon transcriptional repressor
MSHIGNSQDSTLSPAEAAAREGFMPAMRELVRTYQAFTQYSDAHIRKLGLTPSQFDVIATLGRTAGMSMGELAEKTLVTKGTLTGIVDRLEKKGLVRREVPEGNRRSFTVLLTSAGKATFERVFPEHVLYIKQRFEQLDPRELEMLRLLLSKLRDVFL